MQSFLRVKLQEINNFIYDNT